MSTKAKAWVLLFMLTINEAQSYRHAQYSVSVAAKMAPAYAAANSTRRTPEPGNSDTIYIQTQWAYYNKNTWRTSTIGFRVTEDSGLKYVLVEGLDMPVRLLPDAVVGRRKIKGMPVVQITGWQQWVPDASQGAGSWSKSYYEKGHAILIRADINPEIGVTKSTYFPWRAEGHKVYEDKETQSLYYFNQEGQFFPIPDHDDVIRSACKRGDKVINKGGRKDKKEEVLYIAKDDDPVELQWDDNDSKNTWQSAKFVSKKGVPCNEAPCEVGDHVEARYGDGPDRYKAVIKQSTLSGVLLTRPERGGTPMYNRADNLEKQFQGQPLRCSQLGTRPNVFPVHVYPADGSAPWSTEQKEFDISNPATFLMRTVDSFLSTTSCLDDPGATGGPTCLHRCTYDSDKDVCGPQSFCQVVDAATDPFDGGQGGQKCKAAGPSFHEAADGHFAADNYLAGDGMVRLREHVFDMIEDLEAMNAKIAGMSEKDQKKAAEQEIQATQEKWSQSTELLSIIRTMRPRLQMSRNYYNEEDAERSEAAKSHWPELLRRLHAPDLKHWRDQPTEADTLTIPDYEEAVARTTEALKASTKFSVAAKLHNTLVKFLALRPALISNMMKASSDGRCQLSMEHGEADVRERKLFMSYYLQVPGYDIGSDGRWSQVSAPCRDLLTIRQKGLSTKAESSYEKEKEKEEDKKSTGGPASAGATEGRRPRSALQLKGELSEMKRERPDGQNLTTAEIGEHSLLQEQQRTSEEAEFTTSDIIEDIGGESQFTSMWEDGTETTTDFGFTLACIIVVILCSVIAGVLFGVSGLMMTKSGRGDADKTGIAAMFLGVLVMIGAFAMCGAGLVGIAIIGLIGAIVLGVTMAMFLSRGRGFIQLHEEVQTRSEEDRRQMPLESEMRKPFIDNSKRLSMFTAIAAGL